MGKGSQQHLWINRKYERVGVDLPCELSFPGGGSVPVRILNLSVGGLKFSCDQDTFYRVLPEDQRTPGLVTGVEIAISFQIPSAREAPTSLQLTVSVIHTERLAQDNYHVGVMFTDMAKPGVRALENYINEGRKLHKD